VSAVHLDGACDWGTQDEGCGQSINKERTKQAVATITGSTKGMARAGRRHVTTALKEIRRRFREMDLGVAAVAQSIGVSAEYLSRLCRLHLNRTPLQVIHDCRVREAKRKLLLTSHSIYVVARESGYHSTSELNRNFKRRCGGRSPGCWRIVQRGRR
jgi:transcriptional regulator GlxA family with amidase domain